MISVILCSLKPSLLEQACASIAQTIGVEHEVIAFDNRDAHLGLCEVYNRCASNARFEYLCFVHEDVLFDSQQWGRELIDACASENTGIIGVAGGQIVPKNFISWGDAKAYDRWNFWSYSAQDQSYHHQQHNPANEILSPTVTLDGVFLFVRKAIWQAHTFDENTFRGFHLYDADFSFAIAQTHKNYVHQGIKLLHRSAGNATTRDYYENLMQFHRKWNSTLPYCLLGITLPSKSWLEKQESNNATCLFQGMHPHFGLWASWKYFVRRNNCLENLRMHKALLAATIKRCFHR